MEQHHFSVSEAMGMRIQAESSQNREDVQKHGANRFPGEYKISGRFYSVYERRNSYASGATQEGWTLQGILMV